MKRYERRIREARNIENWQRDGNVKRNRKRWKRKKRKR